MKLMWFEGRSVEIDRRFNGEYDFEGWVDYAPDPVAANLVISDNNPTRRSAQARRTTRVNPAFTASRRRYCFCAWLPSAGSG